MPEARHIALGGVHVTKHEKWSQSRNDGREREWREEERKAGGNHSCLIRMAMAGRQRNVQTTVRRGHKYPNRGRQGQGQFSFHRAIKCILSRFKTHQY